MHLPALLAALTSLPLTAASASAQVPVEVVFSSVSTSSTSAIPGTGGGVFRSFSQIDVSPGGQHWVLGARSTSSSSYDAHLLVDGALLLREFFVPLPWNNGQTWKGGSASVNDTGDIVVASEDSSGIDYLVRGDQAGMGSWSILEESQSPSNGVPGGTWTFFGSAAITSNARAGFVGQVTGANSGTSSVAMFDGQVLAEVDVTVPAGGVGGAIGSIQGSHRALTVSADGQHFAYLAAIANSFAFIVDGAVRVQSGQVLPGSGYTRDVFRITSTRMEPNGDWFASGLNEIDGRDWVLKNGAIIAEEFQSIVPGSTEQWGNASTLSPAFFGAMGHPSGDHVVIGSTLSSNVQVMVRNGQEEIVRTGDPIDLDGNGLFDDGSFFGSFESLGGWGANGSLYANVRLVNSGGSFIGYAVVRFDLPGGSGGPGTVYCQSAPNSTGAAAQIDLSGSPSVQVDDLALACEGLPAFSFGYFITSRVQGSAQGPGGSQGTLCLGGTVGRQVGGVILQADASGRVGTAVHLATLPTPNGPVAGLPGEAWNFQYWYRDANPTVTSNFSSGIHVVLQ